VVPGPGPFEVSEINRAVQRDLLACPAVGLVRLPSGIIEIAYHATVSEPAPRKILVVDDQPMLAKAIRRMLSGHDVTVAGGARDALTMLEGGARYDVIISDLMMPGMSGMELHAAITALAPEQVTRMVFMTGGAFTPQALAFFDEVGCPTLEKQFDRAGLLAVIDNLLA
jgi:CheY-like chemotaxis protein